VRPPLPLLLALIAAARATSAQEVEPDPAPPPVRVACVGDSITFGSGLPDRERTTYPLLLGHLLGEDHEVRNFGVSGATMLKEGNKPWTETGAAREALEWRPEVVVVQLGTNDSKAVNWDRHGDAFEADARALVRDFRAASPEARILLCLPVPAWTEGGGIDGRRVAEGVVPALRRAAAAEEVELLDLHTALRDREGWFPDGVHPNPHGAEAIARRVAAALLREPGDEDAPRFNPCVLPQPSVEWRGAAAGWGGGTWWQQHEAILRLGDENPGLELVFLGDSISQGLTGAGDRLARADGERAVDRAFGGRRVASFGLSGDRTEHLLWRIGHGAFDAVDPRLVVLLIGVNNINTGGDPGEDVAAGIEAVVHLLREREPQAEVLLLGCFPTKEAGSWARRQTEIVHQRIAPLGALDGVRYLDLRPLFLRADGSLDPRTMRADGVHITAAGQEAWLAAIAPVVAEVLDGPGEGGAPTAPSRPGRR
jgi:acyl-CoA thioesterase-1